MKTKAKNDLQYSDVGYGIEVLKESIPSTLNDLDKCYSDHENDAFMILVGVRKLKSRVIDHFDDVEQLCLEIIAEERET